MQAQHPRAATGPITSKTAPSPIVQDAAWIAHDAVSTVRDAMAHAATWKFAAALVLWFVVAASLSACGRNDLRQSAGSSLVQIQQSAAAGQNGPDGFRVRLAAESLPVPDSDQALLAQQAVTAGLQFDIDVARELEDARSQILAQAYIDSVVAAVPPPSQNEIREFYESHPALYARRRLYRVLELSVPLAPGQFGELQDAIVTAKNLAAIARWLDAHQLPFEATMFSRTAEQIPKDVMQRASRMLDGDIAVFAVPGGASVMWLIQSMQSPVSEKQARASIARYLLERRRSDLALMEAGKLRELARAGAGGDSPRPAALPTMQMTAGLLAVAQEPRSAIDTAH